MYAPTSFAQIEKTNKVRAGDKTTLDIYPKDIYENNVTNVTDKDLTLLEVAYEVNNGAKNDITKTCSIVRVDVGRDFFKCNEKITKAGEIEFTVDYTSEDVECRNCKFRISPDVIDFEKTKVFNKNENKEMSRTELNVLPASVNPLWEMFFFDQYLNPIEDSEEVKALDVKTKFVESDIKLCVKNNNLTKLSNPCPSTNNDENDKKWQYLPNGKDYKLLVSDPKTTLPYPVEIVNGYTGGDPGPIDVNKTSLNPREITLVAGEKGKVQLELRTSDDNRKNYWFDEPEKHISVKFPEDVKKCKYSLERAENPGQYSIVFECTEKKDPFNATVSIDNKPVPEPVTITVVPNALAYSKLFRMTGEEITKPDLGSVSVEDKFQIFYTINMIT
jgi:transcription initiation factor TFIIIB Brf1 subunit/transcription initiation factor TFIIB